MGWIVAFILAYMLLAEGTSEDRARKFAVCEQQYEQALTAVDSMRVNDSDYNCETWRRVRTDVD